MQARRLWALLAPLAGTLSVSGDVSGVGTSLQLLISLGAFVRGYMERKAAYDNGQAHSAGLTPPYSETRRFSYCSRRHTHTGTCIASTPGSVAKAVAQPALDVVPVHGPALACPLLAERGDDGEQLGRRAPVLLAVG